MLYPLLFKPILKETVWGGKELLSRYSEQLQPVDSSKRYGESIELNDFGEFVSSCTNGEYAGLSLPDLIQLLKESLLGEKVVHQYGLRFPLCLKYLDACKDLSIQVHPNDALAREKHASFGKTEMWYVMQAGEEGKVISGLQNGTSKTQVDNAIQQQNLEELVHFDSVRKGDCLFIEAGQVHALLSGTMVAEIQQASDITYRLYDYNRLDADGQKRELHVDAALEAIDFSLEPAKKKSTQWKDTELYACRYFQTQLLHLSESRRIQQNSSSFTALMCLEGEYHIQCGEQLYPVLGGETVLIPAGLKEYSLISTSSTKLLHIRCD